MVFFEFLFLGFYSFCFLLIDIMKCTKETNPELNAAKNQQSNKHVDQLA